MLARIDQFRRVMRCGWAVIYWKECTIGIQKSLLVYDPNRHVMKLVEK
jgi:uncharacterized protein YheU (UPF0270 family)